MRVCACVYVCVRERGERESVCVCECVCVCVEEERERAWNSERGTKELQGENERDDSVPLVLLFSFAPARGACGRRRAAQAPQCGTTTAETFSRERG